MTVLHRFDVPPSFLKVSTWRYGGDMGFDPWTPERGRDFLRPVVRHKAVTEVSKIVNLWKPDFFSSDTLVSDPLHVRLSISPYLLSEV